MKRLLGTGVLLCALAFGLTGAALGQNTPVTPPTKADYSQEPSVIEEMASKIAFEADGTSIREQTTRVRVQNDAGVKEWGLLVVPFEGDTQTVDLDYVRVHKPDGTTVETSADDARDLDSQITRDAPLYSDLREKHVAVRGLGPGDVLEYGVHWRTTKALTPGQFWFAYSFNRDGIVLNETLQMSVPADRAVKVKGPGAPQSPVIEKGRRIYTWSNANLDTKPKAKSGRAAIDAALGLNAPPDVQISTFQSWDEVGNWYWNLQKDRVEPTPEIRAKAAELTKSATTDLAKVNAIYDFVSLRYRYIGVDFGIGRFRPHAAADVLANNFGDCKDKETLLASLLSVVGVPVNPVLISANIKIDPDIPSPAQFNHLIGYVATGPNGLWLDTTPEVAQEGYLLPALRGKQALVISGEKSARLMETPADPPEQGLEVFKVDAKLTDDGSLSAKIEDTARNDGEPLIRTVFRQASSAQYQELVQQLSYRLGFAGTVSEVKAGSPEATAEPFRFSYTYFRKDYPDWDNRRLVVPGLPFTLPSQDEDADSTEPVYLGSPGKIESDTRVELPSGFSPELPANVDLVRDYAEYHAVYSREGNTLVSRRSVISKLREVPASELADYKKFTESVRNDVSQYVETMSLKSSTTDVLAGAESFFRFRVEGLPDSKVPDANRLEQDGLASARQSNRAEAISNLKQAVTADPKFTRGWLRLGILQYMPRNAEDSVASFRSAVESDPKQPISYKMLASLLAFLDRPRDAIEVLQDLLRSVPDDPEARGSLAGLLVREKRYGEAIPELQAALKMNPDDAAATANLALSYLISGDTKDGHEMMARALELGPAPNAMNNVAYELADANRDLSDALDYAQKAVQAEEKASQKIDLYHLTPADLPTAPALAEFWDTLGWVQFRLGHAEEAENTLSAAWKLSEYATIGDHLAQVEEQLHKTKAAVHMYLLALATLERRLPVDRQATVRKHVRELDPKADFSTMPGIRVTTPTDELLQMRTVHLPRILKGPESAEFFLLFSPKGDLEDAQFVSGSDKLADSEKTLIDTKFQVPFPDGSDGRILRRGLLMCTEITGCQLTFLPLDSVHSVN